MTFSYHRRTQFPVGEGFFHAGLLEWSSGEQLNYVYDCGSQRRYAAARAAAIADYRSRLRDHPLDLLYLSHAHADHINGVPALLDDLTVGTIVLPLMGVYERLVAFARSLVTEQETPGDFFEDWVVDPVAAAVGQGPDRVVVVRPSTPGIVPPSTSLGIGLDPELAPEPGPEPDWNAESESRSWDGPEGQAERSDRPRLPRAWAFAGPGAISAETVDGPHGDTAVVEIADTIGIRPGGTRDAQPWIFATHVSPYLAARRVAFFKALAAAMGGDPVTIEVELQDPAEMRRLIVEKADTLLTAYRVVRADVNLTSMCLYSGPSAAPAWSLRQSGRGSTASRTELNGPVTGWLGTGDAKLSVRRHRNALIAHLATLLPYVDTATLAHHGAENGFSDELLAKVPAQSWVAPAAPYLNWQHPHPEVERAVEYAGRRVVHVDGDSRSVFEEDFHFPCPYSTHWPIRR